MDILVVSMVGAFFYLFFFFYFFFWMEIKHIIIIGLMVIIVLLNKWYTDAQTPAEQKKTEPLTLRREKIRSKVDTNLLHTTP